MNTSRQPALFHFHIFISILIVAFSLASCTSTLPPTGQISISIDVIKKANAAGGMEFAPLHLHSAMQKMVYAEHAMQNKKFELANQLAEEAQVEAELVLAKTRTAKAQQEANSLNEDSRLLRHEIDRKAVN